MTIPQERPPLVTIVLNLHDERRYLRRTLRSLAEAACYAAGENIAVELVCVLDRATDALHGWLAAQMLPDFIAHRVLRVDCGSLGPARNAGIAAAQGAWIMLADADDLISFNSITAMLARAQQAEQDGAGQVLVFPEYVFEFGGAQHFCQYYGHDQVTPLAFFGHPYISRCLATREFFASLPFPDASLRSVYAFEDWHFNATAIDRGWHPVVARDAVLYYRKRPNSLLERATQGSAQQIPPCDLFLPRHFLAACAAPADWPALLQRRGAIQENRRREALQLLRNAVLRELMFAANRIDPAIQIGLYRPERFWTNVDADLGPGMAYYHLCQKLCGFFDQAEDDRPFTDIFLIPFLVTGGAEKYLLNIIAALPSLRPDARVLLLGGQKIASQSWHDRIPPHALYVDLHDLGQELDDNAIDLLTLKTIQAVGATARLHLKHSEYAMRFFRRFARLLAANQVATYRFMDDVYASDGRHFLVGHDFDFISDCLEHLDFIVTDQQAIIARDQARFGIDAQRWQWLATLCETAATPAMLRARPPGFRRRLLWASRLDAQKRPGLVCQIAQGLAARGIDVAIDMRGSAVLGHFDHAILSGPGVQHLGPYEDFAALDHAQYDGFLYTSAFDGLPNVLLEALGAGLPVIAPDIGGIAEVVLPGRTGFLVPDLPDDAALVACYCDAVQALYEDEAALRDMALAAQALIAQRHSGAAFIARLREIFGNDRHDG